MKLHVLATLALLFAFETNARALPPTPTPTPTPRPKLSGGFGRAVVTPSSPGATGQSLADVVHAASTTRGKDAEKKPGVRIDNDTLVTDPSKGKVTTAKAAPGASGGDTHPGADRPLRRRGRRRSPRRRSLPTRAAPGGGAQVA